MINYCFIVKNINGLERRISTIKMEHFRKSDTYSVYFNGKTVLAQDSEDLFGENSMSLAPQETIDLCANSLEVPTVDSDPKPDLEFDTTSNSDSDDSFSANGGPSFWDEFWEWWCIPDTPDSPSCDDGPSLWYLF